jgi:hypothetical protein
MADAFVSGPAGTTVYRELEILYGGIKFYKSVHYVFRIILRTVIHDNQFPVRVRLRNDTFNGSADAGSPVERWQNNRYQCAISHFVLTSVK